LAEEYLEQMRLTPSEYRSRQADKTLSGGERKKVELASILAMKPKLAILDEPDSGIDMLSQEAVIHLIREIKGYGGSVILITHDEEVVKISDRAALMCSGLAFKIGSPAEIIDYYKEHCKPCPTKHYPSQEGGR
jgi:Fe-S cluster assembly ATP-binding protein